MTKETLQSQARKRKSSSTLQQQSMPRETKVFGDDGKKQYKVSLNILDAPE